MRMTEHQQRLWLKMISLIQDYIDGKTNDFFLMVGKLEGALDAAEIEDKEVVAEWYDCWTPLESRRVIEGNQITREKALRELETMRHFLEAQLRN